MSRFVIGERRFRELVAGKVIRTRDDAKLDLEIVLGADVTPTSMIRMIVDAMAAAERPGDPPEAREFLSRRSRRQS